MPRGWKLGALLAFAIFVGVWTPVTWLATRDGSGTRPGTVPRPEAASIDGRWLVDPARSSISTPLVSVSRLNGDARIAGRVLVRAHLRGGRATFDLRAPVSLRSIRQGRTEHVSLSGKARLLFVSRDLTVPVGVLWVGDRLRILGRRGDNELRLELYR